MLTFIFSVLVLAVVALAIFGFVVFNSLVQVRHNVDQAWSNIDVLLKQRHDELPKLLDTVRSYMRYESELLDRITALRVQTGSGAADGGRLQSEDALSASLSRLFAVAEGYPDLKANSAFLQLQSRISALEEQIAHRREFYNEAVNINNVRMEQMPDRLLSSVAGMVRRALFEASAKEKADLVIGDSLSA